MQQILITTPIKSNSINDIDNAIKNILDGLPSSKTDLYKIKKELISKQLTDEQYIIECIEKYLFRLNPEVSYDISIIKDTDNKKLIAIALAFVI